MVNAVVHVELIGPEPEQLRAFYAALFGWDSSAGALHGRRTGFHPHAVFSVGVDDVAAAALQQTEELGGAVALPLQRNEAGGVIVGHFRDPAGNLVVLAGPD